MVTFYKRVINNCSCFYNQLDWHCLSPNCPSEHGGGAILNQCRYTQTTDPLELMFLKTHEAAIRSYQQMRPLQVVRKRILL